MAHRSKMDWAVVHLQRFRDETDAWFKGNPNAAPLEIRGDEEEREVFYVGETFPADRFALIVGDVVQNMRQSLDHLAYSLAEAHSGPLTDEQAQGSEFPVYWDRPLGAGAEKKKIGAACPCARAFIKRKQPHLAGDPGYSNEALWRLHELSRIDKHRLLLPIFFSTEPGSFDVPGYSWETFRTFPHDTLERGTKVASFTIRRSHPGNPVRVKLTLVTDVSFADGPLAGHGVNRSLTALQDEINREVVAPLERYLLPHDHI